MQTQNYYFKQFSFHGGYILPFVIFLFILIFVAFVEAFYYFDIDVKIIVPVLWTLFVILIVFNFKHKLLSSLYFRVFYRTYLRLIQKEKKMHIYFFRHNTLSANKYSFSPITGQKMAMCIYHTGAIEDVQKISREKNREFSEKVFLRHQESFKYIYEHYAYVVPYLQKLKNDRYVSWVVINIVFSFMIFFIYTYLTSEFFMMLLKSFGQYSYVWLFGLFFVNIVVIIFLMIFFLDILEIKDNFYRKKIYSSYGNFIMSKNEKEIADSLAEEFMIHFYYKSHLVQGTEEGENREVFFLPGYNSSIAKFDKVKTAVPGIVASIILLISSNIFLEIKHDMLDDNTTKDIYKSSIVKLSKWTHTQIKQIKAFYEDLQ